MRYILAVVLLLALGAPASGQAVRPPDGGASELTPLQGSSGSAVGLPAGQDVLLFSIVIENREDGTIRAVKPPAMYLMSRPGVELGRVTQPATAARVRTGAPGTPPSYPALAASGHSGLRLRLFSGSRGAGLLDIHPAGLLPEEDSGFVGPVVTGIHTDIAAGSGIFGGAESALPGNPVGVYRNGQLNDLSAGNVALSEDDIIVVQVLAPDNWPKEVVVPNRAGAHVQYTPSTGEPVQCGLVATAATPLTLPMLPRAAAGSIIRAGLGEVVVALPGERQALVLSAAEGAPDGVVTALDGTPLTGYGPLFNGFIYPNTGQQPAGFPELTVAVRMQDSDTWVPVDQLLTGSSAPEFSAVRFRWGIP